ncbi:MAG TPA: DUF1028 domain-containing protein [Anaeromyxobacteraceae bacterium]|nr:DUF1028 domain-containing protein [Anaeromyxobacteraceae bacterium]
MITGLLALTLGTFSIVAADPATGEVGVAVQSKFPAVGAIVPAARAGVGAVATQALANVAWRDEALAALAKGEHPKRVLKRLAAKDRQAQDRQIGLVDVRGRAAAFTGARCFDHASHFVGDGFAAQGNILASRAVVEALASAYADASRAKKPLAERLLVALEAAQRAGGDRRGMESAALLVVKPGGGYGGTGDAVVDLRVDDAKDPIAELRRLYFDVHQYYFGPTVELVHVDERLASELQQSLARLGYYRGPSTGTFDAATRQALVDWQGWENLENREARGANVDALVLQHLRRQAAEKR